MANDSARSRPRSQTRHFVWPIILIAVGLILLLQNFGYLPWSLWEILVRFWPAVLILIGIELLLNRTNPWLAALVAIAAVIGLVAAALAFSGAGIWGTRASGGQVEHLTQELGTTRQANVEIVFGAGELEVGALAPTADNLMEGDFSHRATGRSVSRSFRCRNEGECTLRLTEDNHGGFPFGGGNGAAESWQVGLTPRIPLDLTVQGGASKLNLDLSALQLTNLRLDIGASNGTVNLPASGTVAVKVGAADLTLQVPADAAARIRARGGLSSMQVDEQRFPRNGDYYTSPGYDTASTRLDVDVDAGVSTIRVR